MRIADRRVGPGEPVFLCSEIGVTSCGSVTAACDLIDASSAADLDAVKFVLTMPDKIMRTRDVPFSYETAAGITTRPIYDVLAETIFSIDDWRRIAVYARHRKITFFATADHVDGVALLEAIGVPAHKLSSWDLSYLPLLEAMRRTGKPVLVDVGVCTREELLAAIPDEIDIMPVHAPHPIDGADWNMSRCRFFRPDYAWGFSAPGREHWPDLMALGGGACFLEKRLTLRRNELTGHHHAQSLEPDELRQWATLMRLADASRRADPFEHSDAGWAERAKWNRDAEGLRP